VTAPTTQPIAQWPSANRAADAVKVAVFDQCPLFRAGIAYVLRTDPHVDVISVSETFELGRTPACDVVVMDAAMMMSALGATRSNQGFRFRAKLLVLAFSLDEDQFLAAFAAGARGYLLKGASEHELVEAVHAVHGGDGYVSPGVAAIMLCRGGGNRRDGGVKPRAIDRLSHREGEIFKLLPAGLTNREIGQRLGVTENTIKRYFTRIFEKLHVRNRVEAAMLSRFEATTEVVSERRKAVSIGPLSIPLPIAEVVPMGVQHAAPGQER
jgi:two-component system nitrate/nitrite response regulator NarL